LLPHAALTCQQKQDMPFFFCCVWRPARAASAVAQWLGAEWANSAKQIWPIYSEKPPRTNTAALSMADNAACCDVGPSLPPELLYEVVMHVDFTLLHVVARVNSTGLHVARQRMARWKLLNKSELPMSKAAGYRDKTKLKPALGLWAKKGYTRLVQWALDSGWISRDKPYEYYCQPICDALVAQRTKEADDVVRSMFESGPLHCGDTELAAQQAATHGRLDLIKFLHGQSSGTDYPWSDTVLDNAARSAHLDILVWLVANGHTIGKRTCNAAGLSGDLRHGQVVCGARGRRLGSELPNTSTTDSK
jgi:hypothetical protein